MKICIYIPTASFFVGGGETVPLTQARYLADIGYNVRVAVLRVNRESDYFQDFKTKYPYIEYDYLESPIPDIENNNLDHKLGQLLYLKLNSQAYEYFKMQNFNLVLTHYSAAAISVPNSIPQILYLHGVPENSEPQSRAACEIAGRLVAVSQSVADGWKKLISPDLDITVIRNGIDENVFKPDPDITKDIDILYIGRLIEIKGVQFLIQAVKTLTTQTEYAQVRVEISGDGPYKAKLQELVSELHLESQVHLGGYIVNSLLPNLYHRSHLAVFPSYAKEGVLTTLLEAAASGCCLISSDCCGMKEFIVDDQNGLLFPPQNSGRLAQCLRRAFSDSLLQNRLGMAARQEVLKNWTWNKSISKLDQLIKQFSV